MYDLKKSTTLELTINPAYVQSWGAWEAVRELIQNGLDADDQGHRLTIKRDKDGTIHIQNDDVTLERRTLLLGSTSKSDGMSRGKFGEGYKLAFVVLCRNDIKVQVRTGAELWVPFIEKSDVFGEELLKIKVRPSSSFVNKVDIRLDGITEEEWNTIQARLLDVEGLPQSTLKPEDYLSIGPHKLLTAQRFTGLLYSRGIFVAPLHGQFHYGYDLSNVSLDRDRKAPDLWSLHDGIAKLLSGAIELGKLTVQEVFELLAQDCEEANVIASHYIYKCNDALTRAISRYFTETFGDSAIAVTSIAEAIEASHYGFHGKVVSKALKVLIEKEMGDFASKKSNNAMRARCLFSHSDLTDEELDRLKWAIDLVYKACPSFAPSDVNIVEFFGANVCGTWSPETRVRLARRVLSSHQELLTTLVHEVAHMDAPEDGSVEHRDAMCKLFTTIIANLTLGSKLARVPWMPEIEPVVLDF